MHGLMLAAVLALGASRTDTTLAVAQGSRLELENFAGQIEVTTWTKNAIRVQAEHNRRTSIQVEKDGEEITVSSENERGAPTSVDFQLTVPEWMGLKLSGVYCDISVDGLKGSLEAETVQGDVALHGGSGRVSLQSVQGKVTIDDASGQIEASSVNEAVIVKGARGELTAESVNGAVRISDSQLTSLDASTVNGTVSYDGTYTRGGHYEMSTHTGSVYASIPADADLSVTAETYNGSFDCTFRSEATSESRNRRRTELTFGKGSAELSLESFQGSIILHRPGEKVGDAADEDHDNGGKDKLKLKEKSKSEIKGKGQKDPDDDSD